MRTENLLEDSNRTLWFALLAMTAATVGCDAGRSSAASPATNDFDATPGCELVRTAYGPAGNVPVRAEIVVSGLEVPWGIAFLSSREMLVTERPGRVRIVRDGALADEPVASIRVGDTGEGGLLGIALHPAFAENRFFYIYASVDAATGRENRVERWVLAPDGASAQRDRVIVTGIPGALFHDGGRLRFGPDRMLYIGTGDARQPERAQDKDSLAGKILRVTPDGTVPSDNPIPNHLAFVWGIRNTEGFDWHDDHTMLVTDHGPSGELSRRGHDEVNLASAGANLGWPSIYSCQNREGMSAPLLTWDVAVPPGGATVYRGSAIPDWKGSLLIGTLASKHLHRVMLDDSMPPKLAGHEVYFADQYGRLRDVIMSPDGDLYVTTSNCDGRGVCPREKDVVLRVVPGR